MSHASTPTKYGQQCCRFLYLFFKKHINMLLRGDGAPSVVQTVNAISGGEDFETDLR